MLKRRIACAWQLYDRTTAEKCLSNVKRRSRRTPEYFDVIGYRQIDTSVLAITALIINDLIFTGKQYMNVY